MKKVTFVLIALLFLSGSFVWATGSTESGTTEMVKTDFENSWENYKDEPITLTFFVDNERPNAEQFMGYTQLIPQLTREDTGVTLDIRGAVDDTEQSLNLLIASGDYPDIMMVNMATHTEVAAALIDNDVIWPFKELEEKYGIASLGQININERLSQRAAFLNDDIYYMGVMGWPDKYNDDPWRVRWQTGPAINSKIYEELGSPTIKTFDDLTKVALRIKNEVDRVEYPIVITRSAGRGDFNEPAELTQMKFYYGLNDPRTYWKVGGSHKFYFQAPAFLQMLKDFNNWVNLELVNPIIWTGGLIDKWSPLWTGEGAIEVVADSDNLGMVTGNLRKNFPDEYLTNLPPIDAHPDMGYVLTATGGGLRLERGWAIPKGGNNTLRAAVFVDYMMSDHFQKLNIFGREGIEHEVINGIPRRKPEIEAGMDEISMAEKYWFNTLEGLLRNDYWAPISRQQRMPEMVAAIKDLQPVIDEYVNLAAVPEAANAPYPPNSEEIKIYSIIKETFGDELIRILQGPPEQVEPEFNALMAEIEKMGLSKLNAFQQKVAESYSETVKKYSY